MSGQCFQMLICFTHGASTLPRAGRLKAIPQPESIYEQKTFIVRISTGSSTDRWAAKTADSVCVLSRRIMPNTENRRNANAARTCATTMSRLILLSSWIEVLVTGADVNSDSSKHQVSQSVRMGTA